MQAGSNGGDTVIVIEDSTLIALALVDVLTEAGFSTVGPFANYPQALDNIDRTNPTLCVLDLDLGDAKKSMFGPGEEGRRLLAVLNSKNIPTVVFSGYVPTEYQLEGFHKCVRIIDKAQPMTRVVDALADLKEKRLR